MNRFQMIGAWALVLAACGTKPAKFPPGYTPLDDENQASFPTANGSDKHPESINTVKGSTKSYDYADGAGYIHASISDVWAAMQDPNVVVQHRRLDRCHIASTNKDTTADFSYQVDVGFSLDPFSLAGREKVTDGTNTAPTTVVFRDDLVDETSVNQVDSDSIVLEKIDDTTTSYSVIRHEANVLLGTPETGPKDVEEYITDIYNAVKATVHGQPIAFDSMSHCSS